jgi:hypothetical protein
MNDATRIGDLERALFAANEMIKMLRAENERLRARVTE